MADRKNIGKRLRFEIFKRDAFTCSYCGRTPPAVTLEIDHVVAVAQGGDNDPANLATSCFDCNRGKASGDLTAVMPTTAEVMARRKELESQVEEYNRFLTGLREHMEERVVYIGGDWHNRFKRRKNQWVFGPDRAQSIRTFLKRMPEAQIWEAMDIAFSRKPVVGGDDGDTWRYFCGVCWSMIKGDR